MKMFFSLLGIMLVAVSARVLAEDSSVGTRTVKPFVEGNILFGAHRGGRGWRPEGTLKTFVEGAETWSEIMLESDVHLTKDGVPVLLHDGTVDRTTNGTGSVAAYTLVELKKLDAGYRFTRDDGISFPYRGQGYTIPTLREVLQSIPDHQFMIELKDQEGVAAPTVAVIQETGAVDRVVLASFSATLMEEAKRLEPAIATCYSANTLMRLVAALRSDDWAGYVPEDDLLVMNYHNLKRYRLTTADIPRIQEKGIRVCLYNINDPSEIRELLDLGIDSMLTDRPDVFSEVLTAWRHDIAER